MPTKPEELPYFVRKMDADFQKRWRAADAATREHLEDEAYKEWDRKLGPPAPTPPPVPEGPDTWKVDTPETSQDEPEDPPAGSAP